MIILYTKERDEFVNDVIDWLPKKDLLRVCKFSGFVCKSFISDEETSLIISNDFANTFSVKKIKSVWFHGGEIYNPFDTSIEINKYISESTKSIFESYLNSVKFKKIGALLNNSFNKKIENLYNANSVSFKIPESIITNDKSELLHFIEKFKKKGVICKNFIGGGFFEDEDFFYDISKTFEITDSFIERIPNKFGISLFQEKISKKFEIRIIYFEGTFYSAAIIDSKNYTDIRVPLNSSIRPRIIPYKLPSIIKRKLIKLLNKCNYSYGSIDLIYDMNEDYIFLEINPCGQISFVNRACNYYMEKDFADYLINENYETNSYTK